MKTASAVSAASCLPSSDAPGIVRLRRMVETELRTAVLTHGDAAVVQAWVRSPWGVDDLETWEAYASLLPAHSPARGIASLELEWES